MDAGKDSKANADSRNDAQQGPFRSDSDCLTLNARLPRLQLEMGSSIHWRLGLLHPLLVRGSVVTLFVIWSGLLRRCLL
jgi:hypothetical protein